MLWRRSWNLGSYVCVTFFLLNSYPKFLLSVFTIIQDRYCLDKTNSVKVSIFSSTDVSTHKNY